MEAKSRVCPNRLLVSGYYVIAISLLFIGGSIYLLMRDKSLVMFNWAEYWGLLDYLDHLRKGFTLYDWPQWIVFSLPSGLWVSSYILLMHLLWADGNKKARYVWTLCLPLMAILSEVLQKYGGCPGTFDYCDIIFYTIPILLYISYEIIKK